MYQLADREHQGTCEVAAGNAPHRGPPAKGHDSQPPQRRLSSGLAASPGCTCPPQQHCKLLYQIMNISVTRALHAVLKCAPGERAPASGRWRRRYRSPSKLGGCTCARLHLRLKLYMS